MLELSDALYPANIVPDVSHTEVTGLDWYLLQPRQFVAFPHLNVQQSHDQGLECPQRPTRIALATHDSRRHSYHDSPSHRVEGCPPSQNGRSSSFSISGSHGQRDELLQWAEGHFTVQ